MNNIIEDSYEFIKAHWLDISLAISFLFAGLIFITINNITFNTNRKPSHISEIIVVEGLTNKIKTIASKGFCSSQKGQSHVLEKNCNKLGSDHCNQTECCVMVHNADDNTSKCVAGNKNGPKYLGDEKGNYYNYDFYYYKGKKHDYNLMSSKQD